MIEFTVYTELPHPVIEAIIAQCFSVLTKEIVLYNCCSSTCEFLNNRAL